VADPARARVLVIGVGNELRGDDGAGIEVARRLAQRARGEGIDVEEEQNDPTALIERWRGREGVVLIDAVAGPKAGAVDRLDAASQALAGRWRGSSSTHAVGVEEAVELARALEKLPANVIVFTLGGRRFEAGAELSEEVAAAVPVLADQVLAEAVRLARSESGNPQ
jgi:hydrogenase maturation protease